MKKIHDGHVDRVTMTREEAACLLWFFSADDHNRPKLLRGKEPQPDWGEKALEVERWLRAFADSEPQVDVEPQIKSAVLADGSTVRYHEEPVIKGDPPGVPLHTSWMKLLDTITTIAEIVGIPVDGLSDLPAAIATQGADGKEVVEAVRRLKSENAWRTGWMRSVCEAIGGVSDNGQYRADVISKARALKAECERSEAERSRLRDVETNDEYRALADETVRGVGANLPSGAPPGLFVDRLVDAMSIALMNLGVPMQSALDRIVKNLDHLPVTPDTIDAVRECMRIAQEAMPSKSRLRATYTDDHEMRAREWLYHIAQHLSPMKPAEYEAIVVRIAEEFRRTADEASSATRREMQAAEPKAEEQVPEELFYIQETTTKDDRALWWRPERKGYTFDIGKAGLYSKEDAAQIASIRGTDRPWRKSEVDAAFMTCVERDKLRREIQREEAPGWAQEYEVGQAVEIGIGPNCDDWKLGTVKGYLTNGLTVELLARPGKPYHRPGVSGIRPFVQDHGG